MIIPPNRFKPRIFRTCDNFLHRDELIIPPQKHLFVRLNLGETAQPEQYVPLKGTVGAISIAGAKSIAGAVIWKKIFYKNFF